MLVRGQYHGRCTYCSQQLFLAIVGSLIQKEFLKTGNLTKSCRHLILEYFREKWKKNLDKYEHLIRTVTRSQKVSTYYVEARGTKFIGVPHIVFEKSSIPWYA